MAKSAVVTSEVSDCEICQSHTVTVILIQKGNFPKSSPETYPYHPRSFSVTRVSVARGKSVTSFVHGLYQKPSIRGSDFHAPEREIFMKNQRQ